MFKSKIKTLVSLLRVKHYVKNGFIFLPLFFSLKILDINLLILAAKAFLGFSLLASAVYIVNDIIDYESDRKHQKKRERAIAAGLISRKTALVIAVVLAIVALIIAYLINQETFILFLIYLAINIAYSLKLKHYAVIDVIIIAIGFCLRVFIGGAATGVDLSQWIIVMTFLLSLFLGLAKRVDDINIFSNTGVKLRKSVDGYNRKFLEYGMVMMGSITIVAYLIYTLSPEVINRLHTNNLYFSAVFVIMGIFRYMQNVFVEGEGLSPTDSVFKDRILQISLILWLATIILLLYIN